MSFRHFERSSVFASLTDRSRLLRSGWLRWGASALLLATPMCAAIAAPAAGPGDAMATLTPLQPDSGSITVAAGKDVTLSALEKVGGQRMAGQKVEWTVTGPDGGELSPTSSTTTAQSATSKAGIASTVFHAKLAGSYDVTATTQKNPGCATPSCATWVSTRFAVTVGNGAATDESGTHSGGFTQSEWIGAAVLGAVAIGVAADSNRNNNQQTITIDRTLAIAGGNGQSAGAGKPLALPLQVLAQNNGVNQPSVQIEWQASAGVVLSNQFSVTDSSGIAQIKVRDVGNGPGPITITARRFDNMSASVAFTGNVLQPSLIIVSGDEQSGIPGRKAAPLVVEATLGGSPEARVPIAWAVTSGDAIITSVSNGGNTDASGLSRASVTYGPTPGPITITATRTDTGLSQTFHLTSSITNTLAIISGDDQTGPPNRPLPNRLVVQATTNGAPAANVTINWRASNGATLSAPTSLTLAGGRASIRVTNMGPSLGPVIVTATRSDDPTASVQFTENILQPTLNKISGDGQSGLVNTPAAAPLVVQLVDGGGVPMAGQTISWSVTTGSANVPGSSVTNGSGHATVNFTYGNTPGTITIHASFGAAFQDFTETALPLSGLVKVSGDNQTAPAGATLAAALVVQVQPVVANVPITFSVPTNNASLTTTSTFTDALGRATTTVNLGLTPGAVQVFAQVSGGGPSTTFNETISGTLFSGVMTVVSGNFQVIDPGTPSQPLVILLKGNGSPLANQNITWSTTSGNLSASSSMTDASGHAQVTVMPTTTGPFTVTAQFAGFAQFTAASVSFSENTTLGSIPNLPTNEQSVGAALDSACTDLQSITNRTPQQQDLLNQCLSLGASSSVSSGATAEAIHQLTPRVAETQSSTATTATTAQFDNLAGRMNALRGGAHGVSFAGLAFNGENGSLPLFDIGSALMGAADKQKKEDETFSRWGLFASGQIGRQDGSAQGSTPGYSLDSSGITIGVDYRVKEGLVLGGAIGYTRQSTDLDGGGGNLKMNGTSLSGYATWYQKNDWYVDTSVTWGDDTFDSQRHIAYTLPLPGGGTTSVDQVAQASSGGNDWAGSFAVGRDFHHKATSFGFYGKMQYSHQNFDAFNERLNAALPGSGLGLRVDARTNTSFASVLGAKIDFNHSMNWGVLIPHAEAEWQHEFRTDPGTFTAFFLDDPTNTPILIKGDSTDSDFFRLGLGVSVVLPQGRSGFLLYNRTIGRQGITEYNVSLGFRVEF